MYPQHALPGSEAGTSLDAAQQLQRELIHLDVSSDVLNAVRLVVWCRYDGFWWRTGWEPGRKRAVYGWHPLPEPGGATRRVALHYAGLRSPHLHSSLIAGVQP
jgi:hypothetical protein